MEITDTDFIEVQKQLDQLPLGLTKFEFENFFLESHPTPARQLTAVMLEIENVYAQITRLKKDLSQGVAHYTNVPHKPIEYHRQLAILTQKYTLLTTWYNKINSQMRTAILKEYESQEEDYWANYLGRQAALELLSLGRVSKETMDKMSSLPVNAFEDTVRICTRYASLIKNTTQIVEDSMSSDVTGLPTS